nr:unnamed protein product [Callosobruchus analis]
MKIKGKSKTGNKDCERYKEEAAIQRIKVTERIPYSEAKKKLQMNTPRVDISYRSVASEPSTAQKVIDDFLPKIILAVESSIQKSQINVQDIEITVKQPPARTVPSNLGINEKRKSDGFNTQEGVGAALTTFSVVYQDRLNANASICMTELYAILKALEFICSNETPPTCLVCSDSLSVLKALNDPLTMNPLLQQVFSVYHRTTLIHKQVIFVWCPGHVNIPGNELADGAAREAIYCDTYDDKLLADDFKTLIKMQSQRL